MEMNETTVGLAERYTGGGTHWRAGSFLQGG